jgi:hypothetical protein
VIPRVRRVIVCNTTFNNISVMSLPPVLLVVVTRVLGGNNRSAASHWQTLSRNVVSSKPRLSEIQAHNFCGDRHWLHSKHNYYAITTMTASVTPRILGLIDGPGNGWIHAIMNINILKYYFGPLLRWSFLSSMETTITNMNSVVPWLLLQQNNPRGHEYHTIIDPVIVLFILTFIFVIV